MGSKADGLKAYKDKGIDVVFAPASVAAASSATGAATTGKCSDVLLVLVNPPTDLPTDKKAREAKAAEILDAAAAELRSARNTAEGDQRAAEKRQRSEQDETGVKLSKRVTRVEARIIPIPKSYHLLLVERGEKIVAGILAGTSATLALPDPENGIGEGTVEAVAQGDRKNVRRAAKSLEALVAAHRALDGVVSAAVPGHLLKSALIDIILTAPVRQDGSIFLNYNALGRLLRQRNQRGGKVKELLKEMEKFAALFQTDDGVFLFSPERQSRLSLPSPARPHTLELKKGRRKGGDFI
ncbi:hypothetical protein OC842_007565 [Tilletia horrida]|uniref:Uncharacterized protein n=1 Tax=Tilletia horrida TaxID=155126 RepID=A0AAN6G5V9_9BASI|nr:hypothetical protein OC842_007565 [Tilletia horrida]KAK0544184.1 hypothetical protein OC844_007494 [Tilletia horrida]